MLAHDVFISYSNSDKKIADAICATLEARGIRCWIAPRDIQPSSNWTVAIMNGIAESKAMVLLWTANASESVHVTREVHYAFKKGVAVVPFRIEDVAFKKELEYFLESVHWLDAMTPPLEAHLGNLAQVLKALLNKDGASTFSEGSSSPQRASRVPSAWGLSRLLMVLTASVTIILLCAVTLWAVKRRFYGETGDRQPSAAVRPTDTPQIETPPSSDIGDRSKKRPSELAFKPLDSAPARDHLTVLGDCLHDEVRAFSACIVNETDLVVVDSAQARTYPPLKYNFRIVKVEFKRNEMGRLYLQIIGEKKETRERQTREWMIPGG